MKKFLFVFAFAFVAFTQISMAENPVLNIQVEGPSNTYYYDIYYQIVGANNTIISGPNLVKYHYCFGNDGIFNWVDHVDNLVNLTPPIPSPINYCKVQVYVVISGTSTVRANGLSEYMSFNELTTSAEPVSISFLY